MSEISVIEKRAIVENNLRMLRQQEYDITINLEVNKIADDQQEIERLKALLARVIKKRQAFEKMAEELSKGD